MKYKLLLTCLLSFSLQGCAALNSLNGENGVINPSQNILATLEKNLKSAEDKNEAAYQLGLAYARVGRLEEAEGLLRQVVAANAAYDHALINLAKVNIDQARQQLIKHTKLASHGETQEAIALLQQIEGLRK